MARVASCSVPSISHRGPCRLGLSAQARSVDDVGLGWIETVHTKGNSRVLLPHIVALLIGEEHVGRQTTLGRIGVWRMSARENVIRSTEMNLPFFFLPPSAAPLALVLRVVVFSLGIASDLAFR